jgi:tetratricopeptide (TPR) repeat protein
VAIVYRGVIGAAQLVSDVDLIHTDDSQKIADALYPLGGRSAIGMLPVDGLGFSQAYYEGGYYDDARREVLNFIRQKTKAGPPNSVTDSARDRLPDAYHQLARTEEADGNPTAAIQAYRQALHYAPAALGSRVALALALWQTGRQDEAEDQLRQAETNGSDPLKTHSLLARTRSKMGQPNQAIKHYQQVVTIDPHRDVLRLEFAVVLRNAGRVKEAIEQYQWLLKNSPQLLPAANNLAWLFATYPDPQIRNGPEAIRLATQICRDTQFQQATYLDTLAAAYAESGRFSDAVATAHRALERAESGRHTAMAHEIRVRIKLYEQRSAYRDPLDTLPGRRP